MDEPRSNKGRAYVDTEGSFGPRSVEPLSTVGGLVARARALFLAPRLPPPPSASARSTTALKELQGGAPPPLF